ncbi:11 kDa late embryogenesis abundant protein-like [Amaranthus tricolor]|uniref:11 kDa late embryogenesis abundant protein-like n=1 Tax=Amaranthus tricolor TaxID=29722 RepID=UPI0025853964|nr:11 kDa late embryogenesis abundant protein-like [Amaranthus tricolor]
MQTGKKAADSAKESTTNMAASAKSGMDKTKPNVQDKADQSEEQLSEAELRKQHAMIHNAAEKDAKAAAAKAGVKIAGGGTRSATTTTTTGTGTGFNDEK